MSCLVLRSAVCWHEELYAGMSCLVLKSAGVGSSCAALQSNCPASFLQWLSTSWTPLESMQHFPIPLTTSLLLLLQTRR